MIVTKTCFFGRAAFRKDAKAKTRRPSYTVQRSETARTQRSNRRNRIPVNGRASELQAAERKHGSCLSVCQYRFILVVVAWHMQYVSRATLTCDPVAKGRKAPPVWIWKTAVACLGVLWRVVGGCFVQCSRLLFPTPRISFPTLRFHKLRSDKTLGETVCASEKSQPETLTLRLARSRRKSEASFCLGL
ncbi:hypothetical protein BJV82DRAFT_285072 [Fennellomyces sp. T-0311]|nr:hypothetical protein BJV82DRAFT_282607 [Fennellomyces sp. T-0311]KAI8138804.1 hypothetical protein BJV82DRAFT_285072 [Fennellomyces sp. T-0311]